MRGPRISVIVPVYNVASYLPELVESVQKQTEEDYELLLVDNNSTDGVWEYMQQVPGEDGRIRIFQQKIQGVGAARNMGLDQARGEYVIFLDGDDHVDANMFALMTAAMDQGADLSLCGYITEYQGQPVDETAPEHADQMSGEEFLRRLYEDDTVDYQGFIWNKMFRRSRIQQRNLRFREDIAFNEDRLFLTHYLLGETMVRIVPEHLYHYRVREDSAMGMGRKYFANEREMTEIVAFEEILELLEECPGVLEYARRNMAIAQIRLFKRMMDKYHFFRYRKSILRKYARQFKKLGYEPRDYNERAICRKYIFYGYTGISFGIVDTRRL